MVTVRLDPALEQQVDEIAKDIGLTRSEFIRKSILHYIDIQEKQNAWETGKDLFGKYSSGKNDLSVNGKKLLKDKIKAKRKNAKNPY